MNINLTLKDSPLEKGGIQGGFFNCNVLFRERGIQIGFVYRQPFFAPKYPGKNDSGNARDDPSSFFLTAIPHFEAPIVIIMSSAKDWASYKALSYAPAHRHIVGTHNHIVETQCIASLRNNNIAHPSRNHHCIIWAYNYTPRRTKPFIKNGCISKPNKRRIPHIMPPCIKL